MSNKRATIIISGEVQDAGFRGKVMRTAQKSGLVGYVENLPDGSVRVICEGEEENINDFVKLLDIHEEFIDVENIKVEWSDAIGEFEIFKVEVSNLANEMFQGFATAGMMLGVVGQKVDTVGEKIDNLTVSTKENFNELGEKYHVISEAAISIQQELVDIRKNNTQLLEAITLLVKDHVERDKQ